MVVEYPEALLGHDRVTLRHGEVPGDHLLDQLGETDAWLPAQLPAGFAGVAEQCCHLGRTEVARIDADDDVTGLRTGIAGISRYAADLVDALAFPGDADAQVFYRLLDKLAD